jgi:uncharacterized Zn-binding protein involved in type VI secretion
MAAPAARVGDGHVCPAVTGTIPHVGGQLLPPGAISVLIEGRPAAVVGGRCVCAGPAAAIQTGSATVLIEGYPAARLGSGTNHGGSVVGPGAPTVVIGG